MAALKKWNWRLADGINRAINEYGKVVNQTTVINWLMNEERSNILDITCRELWNEYVKEHEQTGHGFYK